MTGAASKAIGSATSHAQSHDESHRNMKDPSARNGRLATAAVIEQVMFDWMAP